MEGFNPFALLKEAAIGNVEAQRKLAEAAAIMAVNCDQSDDPMAYMQDGLVFARLAAAHGGDGDKGRLIEMLSMACQICGDEREAVFAAEAFAVAELVAEQGNEAVGDAIPAVAEQMTPEAMQMAKAYRERMLKA